MDDLPDAKPEGWFVGQAMYHEHRREWRGTPSTPESELEVVREMARSMRLIGEGRVP